MDSETCEVFRRGEIGYEKARRDAVWNGRIPDRYPELVVRPQTQADVLMAVRYASNHHMAIGVRSGGHSWSASFLRDDGMLLDLSKMTSFEVNASEKVANVQPAVHGGDLNEALLSYGLMFPSGHCPTVGLGGFLLQGGFGWNSRKWGLGCVNILGIDVVTANGQLLHANSQENSDLYWAARGAGPGFFGVVTCFYLRLHPLPKAIMTSRYTLPFESLDKVLVAIEKVQDTFPDCLEVSMFVGHDQDGYQEKTIALCGDALADSKDEAISSLDILHKLPSVAAPLKESSFVECTVKELLQRFGDLLDSAGRRYEVDNGWFDTSVERLLPGIHGLVDDMPPAPSHMYLLWWLPTEPLSDMAFSVQGKLWLTYYAISTDPELDRRNQDLVTRRVAGLNEFSKGIQLADENLAMRPARFMSIDNFKRLESIRQEYDPHRSFHTYMRIPVEFEQPYAQL